MAGVLTAAIAAAFAGGVTADPYYEYTTLLLPGNGTNGAQNNTFLDGSTNNFTITRNGNTTQGTFSPFSQTGWGNLFGSGNYLNTASNAAFGMGTGDFTVEAWIFATSSLTGYQAIFADGFVTNSVFFGNTAGGFGLRAGNASDILVTTAPSINQWVHVAVTRSSSTVRLFYNGTQQTTVANSTNFVTQSAYVGNDGGGSAFPGYISNLRVVKGQALYTGNFTPATSTLDVSTVGSTGAGVPTQTITGTVSLLTCQSNRFVDNGNGNSGVGFTFTRTGSPTVVAFSPFNPTASWSAATNGGSGYFDGSGDYLNIASNSAFDLTGDYTVECWFYANSFPSQPALFGIGSDTAGLVITISSSKVYAYIFNVGNTFGSGGTTLTTNSWNHIAVVRSGTTNTCYINGSQSGTTYSSSSTVSSTGGVGIGRTVAGTSFNDWNGYISNFRIVKGTAVYTAAFTPPTAPLTAITNTSLLLNFTNAGIYDATSKNDLETVGNAQISTTQSKWGGSSISFDGTGDYLYKPYDVLLNQLSGNFTMECWIYPTVTNTRMFFAGSLNSTGSDNWIWEITSANKLSFTFSIGGSSVTATSTASISQNTWTYVAVVRNGGTLTQYINGSSDGTSSPTAGAYRNASFGFAIGRGGEYNSLYYTGYIDDFRITIGQARTITASPTAPFPVQ